VLPRPQPARTNRRLASACAATFAIAPLILLAACAPNAGPEVVAADGVLCDITQRLAARDLQVACLLQPGDDPHQFHLTPQQSRDLQGARLVLINGYGLTPALAKQTKGIAVAEQAVPDSPRLEALAGGHGEDHGDHHGDGHATQAKQQSSQTESPNNHNSHADQHSSGDSPERGKTNGAIPNESVQRRDKPREDGHRHGDQDPHVWHDPVQASAMVKLVAQKLEALKPAARERIASRASAMVAVLLQLDRWNHQQLATRPTPTSPLATGHRAFASLARAYGLRELPVVDSLSSSQSLRPQAFEAVLGELKRRQVTMLLAETLPASKSLQRISALSGVPIASAPLVADGLAKATTPQSPGASSVVATLTANTCLIVTGLKGQCDQPGRDRLVQQWVAIQ